MTSCLERLAASGGFNNTVPREVSRCWNARIPYSWVMMVVAITRHMPAVPYWQAHTIILGRHRGGLCTGLFITRQDLEC
jgi:hypothetical protein